MPFMSFMVDLLLAGMPRAGLQGQMNHEGHEEHEDLGWPTGQKVIRHALHVLHG
jgi:hypothetical protein